MFSIVSATSADHHIDYSNIYIANYRLRSSAPQTFIHVFIFPDPTNNAGTARAVDALLVFEAHLTETSLIFFSVSFIDLRYFLPLSVMM